LLPIHSRSIDENSGAGEGWFDPWTFTQVMRQQAATLGVVFKNDYVVAGAQTANSTSSTNCKTISAIHIKAATATAASKGGGKAEETLELSSGGAVVNCAGAWGGNLVDLLWKTGGCGEGLMALPVSRRKRCIFVIHCPPSSSSSAPIAPPPSTPLVIDPCGVYFRPEGKAQGTYICGVSPSEEADTDSLSDADLQHADHVLFDDVIWPALYERVPAFEALKVTSSWAGFYDHNSLDQNAIIGYHPQLANLMLCNGFSGHGLQQSPAAGRAVSELLIEGKFKSIDLKRFSFERIVQQKPIFETGIV